MLAGTYDVQADQAGRITVPSRFRAAFGEEVIVTTALPPSRHLLMFEADAFTAYVRDLFPGATVDPGRQALKRLIMGNAYPLKLDKAGRILLPQTLREAVGIGETARVIGMDSYAEIWDAGAYALWQQTVMSPEMMGQMCTTLQGLSAAQEERRRGVA